MSIPVTGPLSVTPLYTSAGDVLVWWDGSEWHQNTPLSVANGGTGAASLPLTAGNWGLTGTLLVTNGSAVAPATGGTGTIGTWGNASLVPVGYGTSPYIEFGHANGTLTAPTALNSGQTLGVLYFDGYGATGWDTGARAQLAAIAAENWTDAAQGTYFSLATTAPLTTTTAERMRIGRGVMIGTVTDGGPGSLEISQNIAAPSIPGGVVIQAQGADGNGCLMVMDSYGASGPVYTGRAAGGTGGAPSFPAINTALVALTARGWIGAGNYPARGNFSFSAAEAWSATAQGTYASILTTQPLTTTTAERVRIGQGLMVGNATDGGQGTLTVGTVAAPSGGYLVGDINAQRVLVNGAPVAGGGLTSITAGAGLSGGTITTSGTIALISPIAASFMPAHTGDVTSPAGSTVNTLATVNSNVGTFNNVTINSKGLATAGSNVAYITGNQTIALSGDVSGSGTTAITATVTRIQSVPVSSTAPSASQVLQYVGGQWTPTTVAVGGGTVGSGTGPQIAQYATGTSTVVGGATLSGDATIAQGGALTLAASGVTAGTYNNVTVNLKGLVTGGSTVAYLTTSGISGMTAGQLPVAATATTVTSSVAYGATGNNTIVQTGATGVLAAGVMPAFTGDVTTAAGGTVTTLAASGVTAGTYNTVTVNLKGLVTGGSNAAYLTAAVTSLTAGTGITLSPTTITATGSISITAAGVTNALLATMATNTIKGNNTAGTAAPVDMTVAQTMTLLGAAPLASPTFTGAPNLPTGTVAVTQTAGNNTTALATTAFVATAVGNYLPLAGGTLTGKLTTVASAAANAGLTLPHGAAPTAPVNGDVWTTTGGMYARINGVTAGPFGAGGGTVTSITQGAGLSFSTTPLTTTGTISVASAGITNAMLATMAANTIKGNNTGAVGAPLDLTVAQVQTMIGLASYLPLVGGTISGTAPGNLTINRNAAAAAAVPGPAGWQVNGADGEYTTLVFDTHGGGAANRAANIILRTARGTGAAPTANASGDALGGLSWTGYDGTSWVWAPPASINAVISENWSSTAHGTYLSFTTNQNTTTAPAERMRLGQGLMVGSTTDPGVNNLMVGGSLAFNNSTTAIITLTSNPGYTSLYAPDGSGNSAVFAVGNAGNNANLSRNGAHYFQDRTAANTFAQFDSTGTYNVGGAAWKALSDVRLKRDVADYTQGLHAILALRPVNYYYNGLAGMPDDNVRRVGLIADEVVEIMPELVGHIQVKLHPTPGEMSEPPDTEVLTIDRSALTYALINAVKELKAEIDDLKGRLARASPSSGAASHSTNRRK